MHRGDFVLTWVLVLVAVLVGSVLSNPRMAVQTLGMLIKLLGGR